MLRSASLLLAVFVSIALASPAQEKRPLAHSDFDPWRSIDNGVLTRDGRWLGYSYMPLEGDGEIVLREVDGTREIRVPAGALPPPPVSGSEENPERAGPRREVRVQFTSDNAFAIANTFPSQAETFAAKKAKKRPDDMPKEGVVIVSLATGEVSTINGVRNFQVPSRGGAWLAYLEATAPAAEKREAAEKPAAPPARGARERKFGTNLVLRDLTQPPASGTRILPNVLEYWFARDGRTIVYSVGSRDEAENGLFALAPGNDTQPLNLAGGSFRASKFAWDREQRQAGFLIDRAAADARHPDFAAFHWRRGEALSREVAHAGTTGIGPGFVVSDVAPAFSHDGSTLYVSTAPAPRPRDERLDSLIDEQKVTADLWRWNDDRIPPLQRIRAERERRRSYLAAVDLATGRLQQIGDPALAIVTMTDDGRHGFGLDDRAHRARLDYDGGYQDVYLVDRATGTRELLLRELGDGSGIRWSHAGRWLAWYENGHWHAYDLESKARRELTRELRVSFANELADTPQPAASYGAAGWSRDGQSLVVYDRYDLWQLFPDGRPARNLTQGVGRRERIQFRLQSTEANEPGDDKRGIDLAQAIHLRGESEDTRGTGIFRLPAAPTAAPERLLWLDRNLRYVGRALEADRHIVSASRFDEYPDLHLTTSRFDSLQKVTAGGRQLEPFRWGSSEMMSFRNADGVQLQAALYKPADFDPAKKYPLIVYIYERLSQNLHSFVNPAPGHNVNASFYTSNGYLVLMPDIAYTVPAPGESAVKCVLPAVDEVVRRGFVDEEAIGIQGHSWGGYQVAYLITRTNRFRAASAGALVGNMTSAYSGIRWGSGRARQFQYEKTQSRIGAPLLDARDQYLANSPVFGVKNITTPLLMLHNDQDDAVPWQQGIEFFLAMRRHGKEVYFFNYNGEFHGLRRRADQHDYAKRMKQFFDHHLRGAPAPAWMTEGIPFLEREEEKLRFMDVN